MSSKRVWPHCCGEKPGSVRRMYWPRALSPTQPSAVSAASSDTAASSARGRRLTTLDGSLFACSGLRRHVLEKLVRGIAQRVRRLAFTDDADGGAAPAQLAAQIGEVGIAGDDAEGFDPAIEHQLKGVERQRDIYRILARRVLILQAWRERQPHQRVLPFVRQRGVVAVALAYDDAAKLRTHSQRVFEDISMTVRRKTSVFFGFICFRAL
jgi:hypothetical protein